MSGGFFGYQQFNMSIIADEIADILDDDELTYSDKTKFIAKEIITDLINLKDQVSRLDYLLSGDISEEDFLKDYP